MRWLCTSLTEPSPNLSVCSRSFSVAALRLIHHLIHNLAPPLSHAAIVSSQALSIPQMSSNSSFTVTYSSTTYLCFDCEFDLASTAQLVF
ncbi:hypothetical protein ZIOFF_069923 [Zingiber officinale]|uniref:Uncharacterized protein n=1 Tax=Zingiber officinale TaxID=94328 RepID=A0A8J5EV90_ZINOF|nr:hypothetical protein ZIOFF_069923 [Zingiber officinale]